jgi:hypothetical protein
MPRHMLPPSCGRARSPVKPAGQGRGGSFQTPERDALAPAGGTVIPHARPIGALMIAMIEAPFRAGAMAAARGASGLLAARRATGRRAIRMAPIARRADRGGPATPATGLLVKRDVHGVGATTPPDWTSRPNRGTQRWRAIHVLKAGAGGHSWLLDTRGARPRSRAECRPLPIREEWLGPSIDGKSYR